MLKVFIWPISPKKLHEIERIWTPRGVHPWRPLQIHQCLDNNSHSYNLEVLTSHLRQNPVADLGFPRQLPGGRQHTILPNFLKNCLKLKEFGLLGRGRMSLAPLLRSATEVIISVNSPLPPTPHFSVQCFFFIFIFMQVFDYYLIQ